MRKLWFGVSVATFLLGVGGLALTAYLWFGDWPAETRELVDHYRSVAENTARPPEPLVDDEGRRKLAFDVLRDHYRERAGEDAG